MVNNFELIKNNLRFINDRSFYFIQILKRKKENPEMKSYTIPIESFYIFSRDHLEKIKPRIIEICEQNRARAYIKMNCLDAQSVMLEQIAVITREIRDGNWKHMSKSLNSACGICGKQDGIEKLYLVDVDFNHEGEVYDVNEVIKYIESLPPHKVIHVDNEDEGQYDIPVSKIKMEIPTQNGVHLITTGFDLSTFHRKYPHVDVHGDGNTVLYHPACCD